MNFIKPTIAAVAFTACCLGNSYPARADFSQRENASFHAGYAYGFHYGVATTSCMNHNFGFISRKTLLTQLRALNRMDDMTPSIRSQIVENFETSARKGQSGGKCLPEIRQVLGATTRPTPSYQRADHWY